MVWVQAASATVDVDDDGMSDVWEKLYNFSLIADGTDTANEKPLADFDGDGVSNISESLAGTNPKSATSRFKIASFTQVALSGIYQIQFPQVMGKEYQLQSSVDLQNWLDSGASFVGSVTPVIVNTPAVSANTAKIFYRLTVKDIDSDYDGLSNYEEGVICSNPQKPDSDGDGASDLTEYTYGSDPCSATDGGVPQPITAAQLPLPKPLKFRLFTGVNLGPTYSQITFTGQFLTPYDVNVYKKHKVTGAETLVHKMVFPANANSVFNDITLPDLPDFVYTVQVDMPDLSSSALVQAYRDFSFIVNLAPLTGSMPFAIAPRFNPNVSAPLGALGSVGFNHGLPYNPHAIGYSLYRLVVAPIVVKKVISDQIAGNDANQLPTRAYGGQPNNPMVLGARSGVDTRLRVVADIWSPLSSRALVAIREVATGAIKGSTLLLPSPIQTPVLFNATNGTVLHEVVSGFDTNSNGILEPAEAKFIFEQTPRLNADGTPYTLSVALLDKFYVVTANDYGAARVVTESYGGFPYNLSLPNAAKLITAFATGSKSIPDTSPTTFGNFITANGIGTPAVRGLALALGAKWNSANEAETHLFDFPDGSDLSEKIKGSEAFRLLIGRLISDNKVEILGFAQTGFWITHSLFDIEDQGVDFKKTAPTSDEGSSLGRCRFRGNLEVEMFGIAGGFQVRRVKLSGFFTDLYDFAWPGGNIAVAGVPVIDIGNATKTQAGHATLTAAPHPDAGRIFYTRVATLNVGKDFFDKF